MRRRLPYAFAAYLAFAAAAWFTLDGRYRLSVLAVLALFAFKSWLAAKRSEQ